MILGADPLRRAGILAFVGAAQFFVFVSVAESLYPGYSVSAQPLSDLGATCRSGSCYISEPSSAIFNSTVFVLGALVFVGAFYVYVMRFRLQGGLMALSAWGVMGVALFPETAGSIHTLLSLVAFLFGGAAAVASYRMQRRPLSYFSVIIGVFSLVALVLYASGTYLGLGQGGMERMIVYPELVWVLAFGTYLLSRPVVREPVPVPL
jgi:hypothetical membrane protein